MSIKVIATFKEIIFIKSLLKNMLADTRKQKYIVTVNLGFIRAEFCIMTEWRSQAEMVL